MRGGIVNPKFQVRSARPPEAFKSDESNRSIKCDSNEKNKSAANLNYSTSQPKPRANP